MLISPGQQLFGVSAKLLQFAAIALGHEFNADHFAVQLGAPKDECAPVLSALLAAGWIVPTSSPKARYEYESAMPWRQLRLARTGKPLPRPRADAIVSAMLDRVRAANRTPRPDCALITRVAIFGSYLNRDKAEIGDIDVAFSFSFPELRKERCEGRGSAELNAAKIIKNQSQYVGLTYFDMLTDLGCEYVDVYRIEDDPEVWGVEYETARMYPELFRRLQGARDGK